MKKTYINPVFEEIDYKTDDILVISNEKKDSVLIDGSNTQSGIGGLVDID